MGAIHDDGYRPTSGVPPGDKAAAEAWIQIMALAEAHALIVQAFGGVATLAMPDEQRKAGIRDRVLRAGLWELEP
jgi:hypothetical protein